MRTIAQPLRIGILGAASIVPMALTNPAKSVPEVQILAIASRGEFVHHLPPLIRGFFPL